MNKNKHLKEKAIELRQAGLPLPEICKKLKQKKTTAYEWIKHIPYARSFNTGAHLKARKAAVKANKNKFQALRDAAYTEGVRIYEERKDDPLFRDFITIYLTEGFRKGQNQVAVANCNPNIIHVAQKILNMYADRKVEYVVHYYDDHNLQELKDYWIKELTLGPVNLKFQVKAGAGKLKGRSSVLPYGTMHIRTNDTYLRSKIQAWMDLLQAEWRR